MNEAAWLWQTLRDMFEVDDGSLPEIWLSFQERSAVVTGYELVRNHSAGVVSQQSYFWPTVRNEEVPLSAAPNPTALVVSGESEPFHVVFGGVQSNGVAIPDLGVFVFPSQLVLDYRKGPECRFSEPRDPSQADFLRIIPPFGVRISQNLSPL